MEKSTKDIQVETSNTSYRYSTFDDRRTPIDSAQQMKAVKEIFTPTPNNLKIGIHKDKSGSCIDVSKLYTKDITNKWTVCQFQELPNWLQDNHYITFGYRPPLPSYSACLQSIFRVHTEMMNIWTHLIGCIIFILLAIILFLNQPTLEERVTFSIFLTGAILCLGFSTLYHTFNCHSPTVARLFNRFDYCGIALIIMGSLIPWIYYRFRCHFWLRIFYLSSSTALGMLAVVVSLSKNFTHPSYRIIRVFVFTGFAFSGFVPVFHLLAMEDWTITFGPGTPYILTGGILYTLSAVFYALRIPERLVPGRYNIWFHSHQIFHVLVVTAALSDYLGLIGVYRETSDIECE